MRAILEPQFLSPARTAKNYGTFLVHVPHTRLALVPALRRTHALVRHGLAVRARAAIPAHTGELVHLVPFVAARALVQAWLCAGGPRRRGAHRAPAQLALAPIAHINNETKNIP